MSGLTKLQSTVLEYIADYADEHGHSPSYVEIMDHCGLGSKSIVFRVVSALIERGALEKTKPNAARALRVLVLPDGSDSLYHAQSTVFLEQLYIDAVARDAMPPSLRQKIGKHLNESEVRDG